ncbi:MAG: ABC transporter ATP-binding protein, partial [Gemmatimonadota bacterium]
MSTPGWVWQSPPGWPEPPPDWTPPPGWQPPPEWPPPPPGWVFWAPAGAAGARGRHAQTQAQGMPASVQPAPGAAP